MKRCVALFLALLAVVACHVVAPPNRPVQGCIDRCTKVAAKVCDEHACERDTVVACVAAAGKACDDRTWAHCAVHVGSHKDGGPPAPQPPSDDWE
jgi:hypothetical protein